MSKPGENQQSDCGHPANAWSLAGATSEAGTLSREAQADLQVFTAACEHFRQDIAAHWSQASFFSVIQAALLSLFTSAIGPHDKPVAGLVTPRQEAQVVVVAGLIIALFWFLMAFGREIYIRRWRAQVVHLDGVIDRHGIYTDTERGAGRFLLNPSLLTTILPAVMAVGWTAAWFWLMRVGA